MKCLLVLAVVLGLSQAADRFLQSPGVWSALDQLRGKEKLSIEDITQFFVASKAGEDYPNLASIPDGNFDCGAQNQPGFYADIDTRCQVIRRCDVNGNQTAYLCPNMTIFNQITLVCDWFWNVDCSKAKSFYDYSNARLYTDRHLLDDEDSYVVPEAAGVDASAAAAPRKTAKVVRIKVKKAVENV